MHPDFQLRLSRCRDLPSPPGIALKILAMAQDPDVVLSSAAEVIAQDMALAARMLRIANSPLFASRRRVENLSQAFTLLGLNATLTLALGFSLSSRLRRPGIDPGGREEAVWRRSVVAAVACRLLGQKAGQPKLEQLLLAGLLQDIGTLVLLQIEPEACQAILDSGPSHEQQLALEVERFGCDHAAVGEWIARSWSLPDLLTGAIGASERADSPSAFDACVATSGYVADLWFADDTARARGLAIQQMRSRLGLDGAALDAVLEQLTLALPDVAAMFDVRIEQPESVTALLEQAREVLVLRNLREIQEAARARKDADAAETRVRELSEAVRRDPLTGLFNRTQLEYVLDKEFGTATRHGWPLSIAFLDLDDFKCINDRWGHQVGDQVLRSFGRKLQEKLRATDIVARYGGEEFVVLLPGTFPLDAHAVIGRILAQLSTEPMAEVDGEPLHVTFSAGLATQSALDSFESAEALLAAADKALYMSKDGGRNRVTASRAG